MWATRQRIVERTIGWLNRCRRLAKDWECLNRSALAFDADGRYGNHTDGSSHAAIYLAQDVSGLQVLDQWKGSTVQPVHERSIRFKNGVGAKVNDGDQFYVVE
jgi:hypothetical protein